MYKGVEYSSKKELALAYNMNPSTLITRLNRGMTLDEAISVQVKEPVKNIEDIVYRGVKYKSLKTIGEKYGLDLSIFLRICERDREDKGLGYCISKAMESRGVFYNNKHYKSYMDLASDYNIDKHTLMSRLYLGWGIDEAIHREVRAIKGRKEYCIKGTVYQSKRVACTEFGFEYSLVNRTSAYLGVSWEKGFEFLIDFVNKLGGVRPTIVSYIPTLIYNNVWYKDDKSFCKECNVDYIKFREYKVNHISSDSLVAMRDYTSRTKKVYHYKGKKYNQRELVKLKGKGTTPENLLKDKNVRMKIERVEENHNFKPVGRCIYVKDRYMMELEQAKAK